MPDPALRPVDSVVIEAPARLHLGFVDLNGSLGRRFGSLGLALDGIVTRLRATRAARDLATGPQAERAAAYARRLAAEYALDEGVELTVEQSIPAHAGLGSGTQMALAVGTALSRLHGLGLETRSLAQLLDRGGRSGIGAGAFDQGGFVLDGGRGAGGGVPPVTCRLPFPVQWRVLLILDPGIQGLHGSAEAAAFAALPALPESAAGRLARLTLMCVLPGLAEVDIASFGAGISEIQQIIGDHFAPAQGGRFASPAVARALEFLYGQGVRCLGQSSWGPTGFAVVESEERARDLRSQCEQRLPRAGLEFLVLQARNRGARVLALRGETEAAGR